MKAAISALTAALLPLSGITAQETRTNPSALIVFDASGSMWGQIEGKAKIEIAREVVADLVRDLPSETQLGLMAYGHRRKGDCEDIELLIPVGKLDKDSYVKTVEDIMPKGMTPITASLQLAAESMRYTEQKATVILVSDGLETCDADPCTAAEKLEELGVDFTAHVIAFDLKPEETQKLECIAKSTGGSFFPASDAASLKDALNFAIEKTTPAPKAEPEPEPEPDSTATISAPDTAVAGSEINVTWENQPAKGDYIAVAKAGSKDTENFSYAYTFDKDSITLTTQLETGIAEVRYIAAKTGKVLARQPITLTEFTVTLDAPEEIVAGAAVPVEWTGPDHKNDYITIVPKETKDGEYAKYQRTAKGTPLNVTAPIAQGPCEIRYMSGNRGKVLARRDIKILKADATISAPDEAVAGNTITIEWTGPDNKNDYITIVPKDTEDGKYAKYERTSKGSPLKVVSPDTSGEVEIRYVTGQEGNVLARRDLKLNEPTVTLAAVDEATVGNTISVEWTGPDNQNDYITIVTKDTEDGKSAKYERTSKKSPSEIDAPMTPGEAEIRYMSSQSGIVLARKSITLKAATATLQAPASTPAGAKVKITWTGPDNRNDYITIVPKATEDGKSENYERTRKGNPLEVVATKQTGDAEIRYISGQDGSVINRIPIKITAVE